MLIPHKGHTDTIQVYSVTVMTHVKALQAGHSSQGTSEPITPAQVDNFPVILNISGCLVIITSAQGGIPGPIYNYVMVFSNSSTKNTGYGRIYLTNPHTIATQCAISTPLIITNGIRRDTAVIQGSGCLTQDVNNSLMMTGSTKGDKGMYIIMPIAMLLMGVFIIHAFCYESRP